MKSLKELNEIKEKTRKEMDLSSGDYSYKILVGMATCGMAAGADKVMKAIQDELEKREITNTKIVKTGCIGICRLEPIIEVYDKEGNRTTYVKLDENSAKRIVLEHIVNGQPCKDLTIGVQEA